MEEEDDERGRSGLREDVLHCSAHSGWKKSSERVGEQGFSEAKGGWERRRKSMMDRKRAEKRVRCAWKWTRERGEE